MPRSRCLAACVLLLAAASPAVAKPKPPPDWRLLLRPRDRDRLRDWRLNWTTALAQIRAAGEGERLAREGVLLQPDAALVPPEAPPGDYRCRAIRLGAVAAGATPYVQGPLTGRTRQPNAVPPGTATYVELPAMPCRITAAGLTMLAGVQRPAGRFWRWDGLRDLFLGAVAVGDEGSALDYGRDPDRDVAGLFERIGPARWRLVTPRPSWGAMIEVIEVVPAGG